MTDRCSPIGLTMVFTLAATVCLAADGGRIELADVAVREAVGMPRYVAYGTRELAEYLRDCGVSCRIVGESDARVDMADVLITTAIIPPEGFGDWPGRDTLGQEGFVVDTSDLAGHTVITVRACHPQGIKFGLIELIKTIRIEEGEPYLDDDDRPYLVEPLPRRDKPRFERRGMYAHLHWQYKHPYACRSWSEEDWKRYIDLLSYIGVNLLQCWPMAAMCPDPLSQGDRAYLAKYKRVIDYAHHCRGMTVWPGEAPNNIARDDAGMPIESRRYFDVEVKLDPAKPDDFAAIMASRRNFYETIPNGDAYWVIDCDPGGWMGSPSSEFVDILLGNRKILDEVTNARRETPIVYWMWQGWGTEETWIAKLRSVLADMKARLPEPWLLHACDISHLELAKELGLGDKCTYYPYSTIEHEPSWPITALYFDRIRRVLRQVEPYPKTTGVMANAQTPLVQLPNIYLFVGSCWDWQMLDKSDEDIVRELARLVLPDLEDELAEAWLALPEFDAKRSAAALEALEKKTGVDHVWLTAQSVTPEASWRARFSSDKGEIKLGRVGPLGRFVVPDAELIMNDLAQVLNMHSEACRLAEAWQAEPVAPDVIRDRLDSFLNAALAWFTHTGYERMVGFNPKQYGIDFAHVRGAIDQLIGRDPINARHIHEALNDVYPILAERYSHRRTHETLWRMAGEFYPDLLVDSPDPRPATAEHRSDQSPKRKRGVHLTPDLIVNVPGTDIAIELMRFGASEVRCSSVPEAQLSTFYMGCFEITNRQFRAFDPNHNVPSLTGLDFDGDDQPAVYVSWHQATAFCDWLTEKTGRSFALPTEAQWVSACCRLAEPLKPEEICQFANMADNTALKVWPRWPGVACSDGFAGTAPVGRFKPIGEGLYDTLGNVWEWCNDWYQPVHQLRWKLTDPPGPESGAGKVIRGSSWSTTGKGNAAFCPRDHAGINDRHSRIGFRVCINESKEKKD